LRIAKISPSSLPPALFQLFRPPQIKDAENPDFLKAAHAFSRDEKLNPSFTRKRGLFFKWVFTLTENKGIFSEPGIQKDSNDFWLRVSIM